jgi:uncharacterized membrane protein YfcA
MEFPLSLIDSLLACGIVIIGSVIQGSVGFGLGPLAVPLLVLIDPVFVPGPLLLSALVLTGLIYRREQHAVKHFEIKWAVIGRFVGTVIGAAVLLIFPKEYLSVLFGFMVLIALSILITGIHIPITNRNLLSAGALSGFMGTTSSIGGAPMALLYQKREGPQLRGTLSLIFVIGILMALVSLVFIGRFSLREFLSASVLIPGILLGFFLSKYTSKMLDRGFIRPAVFIIAGSSAAILIIKHFF